nr:SAGA-associated factor 11 homolog [Parasteatoda tepidariorum]
MPDTNTAQQEDRSSSDCEETKKVSTGLNMPMDLTAESNNMKRKIDSIYLEDDLRHEESKESTSEDEMHNQNPNVDIFGYSLTSKKHLAKFTVNCPHCSRKVGALRFAFHLARCMKTGSRRAGRR